VPRINHQQYCTQRDFLIYAWEHFPKLYGLLSVSQQWDVHRYFQPSRDLTELQLRAHRKTVSAEDHSLPNRAGKAYARMRQVFEIGSARPTASPTMVVRAVARPEPNLRRLAEALVDDAIRKLERERGAEAA